MKSNKGESVQGEPGEIGIMKYKSFLLLHLCHFRLAADCQCEHVRETEADHTLNSVTKD